MNPTTPTTQGFREFGKNLKTHWRLWVVPTAVLTVLAVGYAVLRSPVWEASQAFVVRDEAIGAMSRQGRFDSVESMKTTQETVLEIARNYRVVAAALAEVGPPAGRRATGWPTDREVEQAREQITVTAPRGAEFGHTEVIYLTVRWPDRNQAVAMAKAIFNQVELFWQNLRNVKAQSMIDEAAKTAALARADQETSTRRLEVLERELGSDLGELRTLNEQGTGESNLRSSMNKIQEELRHARATHDVHQQQQAFLKAAQNNPDQLLATPSQLLETQPALKRLKEGLVDAQLRKAELMGKMSADHPHVKTAVLAEAQVRQNLHDEIKVALRGVEADLKVSQALVQSLEDHLADVRRRLDRLAGLRARYSNLVADMRRNTENVELTQKALTDAKAAQGSAISTTLITRLDAPLIGSKPVGPSGLVIVLSGFVGGLGAGLGLVVLVAPIGSLRGRRWSDYLPGRRTADRSSGGRRAEDALTAAPVATTPAIAVPSAGVSAGRRGTDRLAPPPPQAEPPRVGRRASDPPVPPALETVPPDANRRSGPDRRGADRRNGGQPVA